MFCVLLSHLGRHVVGDAEGQVLLDALHAVAVLLLGGAQVLLQGACHGREDGLRRLARVHHLARRSPLLLLLQALDVREGLLYCHHQARRRRRTLVVSVAVMRRAFFLLFFYLWNIY